MSSTIVQKIWNFCNTLRDDGVSYGDYLEQLTYLLFLKMADEYSKPPHKRKDINIPAEMNWESLTDIIWLRETDSNCRSLDYEPSEFPLLYPAIVLVDSERIELSILACKANVIPFN